MPTANGKQTYTDIAHRVGIWAVVLGMAVKVFTLGEWVGAADEKFSDAATVETTQRALLLQVNTVATRQEAIVTAVENNKNAIEASRREVLDAIAALK